MMRPRPDDGWEVAHPDAVALDGTGLCGLDRFLGQWPRHNVHAVVLLRRGRLVFERYWRGRERRWMQWSEPVAFSAASLHDIRSITKSVVSLLVGVAIGEGRFPPLDAPVIDAFPEHADLRRPGHAGITFRHLLTMAHGLRWDERRAWNSRANSERQLLEATDPCRMVLAQRMGPPPGTAFNYSGGATTLLAGALEKAVGRTIDAYAAERLFAPLGIIDVAWLRFASHPSVAAFAGLRMRPRDLARIGQLVLEKGRWNGRQIVPAAWITQSTTPRMNVEGDGGLFYGYQWWLGRSLRAARTLGWIAGFGAGGQRLFIVPDAELVLAVNAFNHRDPIGLAILNRVVLPALMDLR
jgi:CubicO group peptidase (beta-lactamase class C family)